MKRFIFLIILSFNLYPNEKNISSLNSWYISSNIPFYYQNTLSGFSIGNLKYNIETTLTASYRKKNSKDSWNYFITFKKNFNKKTYNQINRYDYFNIGITNSESNYDNTYLYNISSNSSSGYLISYGKKFLYIINSQLSLETDLSIISYSSEKRKTSSNYSSNSDNNGYSINILQPKLKVRFTF